MRMKQKFRMMIVAAAALFTSVSASADWTLPEPTGVALEEITLDTDTFYLYNVGMGMYYNQGEAWGTQAIVKETGLKCVLTAGSTDGTYSLVSVNTKGTLKAVRIATDGKIGAPGIFVDGKIDGSHTGANYDWIITPLGDNKYLFEVPSSATAFYDETNHFMSCDTLHESAFAQPTYGIYYDEPQNGDYSAWYFVSKDKYEAELERYEKSLDLADAIEAGENAGVDVSAAQAVYDNTNSTTEELQAAIDAIYAEIAAAGSVENPADLSGRIINATFDEGADNNIPGWKTTTGAKIALKASWDGDYNGLFSFPAFENWQKATNGGLVGKDYQVVTGLPAGVYQFGGVFRAVDQNTGNNSSGAYAYAGDYKMPITNTISQELQVYCPLTEAGDIELGMVMDSTNTNNWVMMDNLTLLNYGNTLESYQFMSQDLGGKWSEAIDNSETEIKYTQSVYDAVGEAFDNGAQAGTIAEAIAGYNAGLAAMDDLTANISAYSNLRTTIDDIESEGIDYDPLNSKLYEANEMYESGEASTEDINAMIETLKEAYEDAKYNAIEEGADVTNLLKNPTFDTNSTETPTHTSVSDQTGFNGWELEIGTKNANPNVRNSVPEAWRADCNVYQTIGTSRGIPNGVYELSTQAYWRGYDGTDANWTLTAAEDYQNYVDGVEQNYAWIYVGSSKSYVPYIYEGASNDLSGSFTVDGVDGTMPNNQTEAKTWFDSSEDMYRVSVKGLCTDGTLTLGFRSYNVVSGNSYGWFIWNNNISLTYRGKDAEVAKEVLSNDVANAQALLDSPMSAEAKSNLEAAISAAESASDWDAIVAAMENLSPAVEAAESSIDKYEELAAANEKLQTAIDEAVNEDLVESATATHKQVAAAIENGSIADDAIDAKIEEINELIKQLAIAGGEASDSNPVDYTSYIVNPSYTDSNKGWTVEAGTGKVETEPQVCEAWNTTMNIYQDITGLPEGTYLITVQALTRNGDNAEIRTGLLSNSDSTLTDVRANAYAQTGTTAFDTITVAECVDSIKVKHVASIYATSEQAETGGWYIYREDETYDEEIGAYTGEIVGRWPNNQLAASIMFAADEENYLTKYYAHVGADGQLRIGMFSTNSRANCWTCFDNWHLYYLGTESVHEKYTGIHNISTDGTSKFFTIDGRQLNSLQKGINIIQTTDANGKTTTKKVVVK